MTTVTGTLTAAGGGRPHGAAVLITLVALDGTPVVGFVSPSEIVGQTAVPVGADGSWSVVLAPTASITSPRGATLYRVDETGATGRARYYISVPASGSAWVGSLRVTLPGSAPEQLTGYLPLTGGTLTGALTLPGDPTQDLQAATKGYVDTHGGGGGSGTPSGTVTSETSYGQAAAAGAATAYAREDHTHGTPPLPTPAAIGGATADHTHAGTYDPAGTASAAVSAHTGAADPHPQYLTSAEGAAVYATLGHTHPDVYPISGYGLAAISGVPEAFMLGSSASNNTIFGARVWIPAGVAITNLWAAVRAGGTYSSSSVPNRLGLYTDAGVRVATTPDDSALWTAAGWRGGALAGGPIAQGAGHFVYLLMIVGGMSGVVVPYPTAANDAQSPWFDYAVVPGNRRAFYASAGGGDLPASFDPATVGTPTTYVPLVGVS